MKGEKEGRRAGGRRGFHRGKQDEDPKKFLDLEVRRMSLLNLEFSSIV